ncbi:ras-specific guanine nucleotide-releasing factor RalGPS2-like [Xenia sp. Carnegie-2017]|uniref:ras-specific guanine nucleotide-releasing factor RalGPS2-like n=1 Tax=Xenia sp. Carnegie-2017 TaxID=2897299 RepID=UPI001F035945|nr:ras-specific guanine nucleotide-releasing factor RalGPS2-like [Xenia sp. Carnegie-2017]XP_046844183.1 ras-specific guanine nucleotide-releasing factor RalGPS2-like [Xenia sp. Carnegie-2017]
MCGGFRALRRRSFMMTLSGKYKQYECPRLRINENGIGVYEDDEETRHNECGLFIEEKDAPAYSSIYDRSFDEVVFDILKVDPEDFARQITLMDIPVFKAIKPEELSSCGWNKKNKRELSPNVVEMTKRFNHVSFWAVKEILNASFTKTRAEVLSLFIRVAKKLLDLQNFHSSKAILSGLQSASVYRLEQTWMMLQRRDKLTFEKLDSIFSITENKSKLRNLLDEAKLPCIPYLGMYLTDLTYLDSIHPTTGGLDKDRNQKMNNIIRVIAEFQQSNYDDIEEVPCIMNYLKSVNYIEELQKFMEDRNYQLSLKIEPCKESKSNLLPNKYLANTKDQSPLFGLEVPEVPRSASYVRKSSHIPETSTTKVQLGHRKASSLGVNIFSSNRLSSSMSCLSYKSNETDPFSEGALDTSSQVSPKTHPIDGSRLHWSTSSSESTDLSIRSDQSKTSEETNLVENLNFRWEDCLKRKAYLKKGKRPAFSSWKRYWVGLCGSYLYFFRPRRTLSGNVRNSYKQTAHGRPFLLTDWKITLLRDNVRSFFQLENKDSGYIYRFYSQTDINTQTWYNLLKDQIERELYKPPQNLISFDEIEAEDTKL